MPDVRQDPQSTTDPSQVDGESVAVCHVGIDIIGVLPIAKGGAKYAIVVVDYFTKWVEAEPLTKITARKVISFVVRNIIC